MTLVTFREISSGYAPLVFIHEFNWFYFLFSKIKDRGGVGVTLTVYNLNAMEIKKICIIF